MPELPEVETVKNALAGLLLNQTIEDVFVFREKNVGPSLEKFLSVKGEKVLSLGRKGKYLIFHLTGEKVLVGHLRMEGKFFFREKGEFDKFDLIVFKLSNGFYLCYNDVRKFGGLSL
jgi:formamidopyrimidine-DNA glycosylase